MASDATTPARDHRLHALTLPLRFVSWARALVAPGIVVLLFARGGRWELWLMLMLAPAALYELIRYFTFRYRFDEDEIVVRHGLIFRTERHIPFARIQNIDLVQNPLHRLLRLADVRLETAGGEKPEGVFRVLSLTAVDEMRQHIFATRGATVAPDATPGVDDDATLVAGGEDSPPPLLTLVTAELARLGLVSNRGLAVVAITIGLAWEFDLFERLEWFQWATLLFEVMPTPMLIAVIAAAVLTVPAVLSLFSVAWTIVRFHGFRLERHGDDFRLRCGLLTRRSATVPRRRIQLVSIRQSIPQRWIDRWSVRVETAGTVGDTESDDAVLSRKWFAPLAPRSTADAIVAAVRPELDFDTLDWQPLAPGAYRRVRRIAVLVALAVSAATLVAARPWGPVVAVVLVPLALSYAGAWIRFAAWASIPGGIAWRSGVWTRRSTATFFDKMQTAAVLESPFDRRYDMASVRVDTAGAGPAGHVIRIRYLDREKADTLAENLYTAAARSEFRLG